MSPEQAFFLDTGSPWPGEGEWDRLYFGAEVCPLLLPMVAEASREAEEAARRGMAFTLVTPWLDDEALDAAETLLAALVRRGPEVVVNDWGLLDLIREREWPFAVALGRLLVKGSAGPRPPAGDRLGRYLEASSLVGPRFPELLAELGIRRVETDGFTGVPPWPPGGDRPAVSFHHPFGLVTVSARCPWRFDGHRWGAGPCSRPCRGGDFALRREDDGYRVLVHGCARVAPLGAPPPAAAAPPVDRLVFHPAPTGATP